MSTTRYTPKEWKGRLGTGINKYIISPMDETGKQTITSAPDTITQEGDALSSTNLNAFEARIKGEFDVVCDAIDDIEDGTTIVEKAKKDEDGNNIKSTYATKTALSDEQNVRQTADTNEQNARIAKDNDLQSQIVNVNGEVDTLNAIVGGEAEIENTDPTEGESLLAQYRLIHHANLLPNGSFGRVGARFVAWNNLIPNKTSKTINGITFTVDNVNRTITMIGTATANANFVFYTDSASSGFKGENNHRYCITWDYFPEGYFSIINNGGIDDAGTSTSKRYGILFNVIDNTKGSGVLLRVLSGNTINRTINILTLTDLTVIGLSSLSFDQFRALFPASSYLYDEGHIYDLNPEGFLKRGVNLWDEETEVGSLYFTDGTKNNTVTNALRSKNYIKVLPNTSYYLIDPTNARSLRFCYYSDDGAFISSSSWVGGTGYLTITTPPSCTKMLMAIDQSYGTTYNHDIQICLDSLPTSVKTTYHASEHQTVLTPQIADGHYVNEDVYDYVENVVEDGIVKGKFHDVADGIDLGTLTGWEWNVGGDHSWSTLSMASVIKPSSSTTTLANVLCARYATVTNDETYSNTKVGISVAATGKIRIYDPSFTSSSDITALLSGIMLYYELAEEEITYVEPLRSFDISDYSTVEPITPQDELVNRIDVPFSVLTKSNNGIIQQITTNKENIDKHTSILSNHNKRLRNLEHKSGDYEEMIYPDEDYGMNGVPEGVEEYAIVSKLRGVTVAYNQQVFNSQFADSSNWNAYANAGTPSLSISGGIGTITCNGAVTTPRFQGSQLTVTNGHTYLLMARARVSASCNYIYLALSAAAYFAYNAYVDSPSVNTWYNIVGIYKSNLATGLYVPRLYFDGDFINGDTMDSSEIVIVDITQALGPSVADYLYSIEQATTGAGVALFKALVKATDLSHETGRLVSTVYESVGSRGKNLIESFQVNAVSTPYSNALLAEAELESSTTYTFSFVGANNLQIYANENLFTTEPIMTCIGSRQSITLVTKAEISKDNSAQYNASIGGWRLFKTGANNTIVASFSEVQCEKGSTATAYSPYMTDSLPLPESVTLRGILKVDNGNLVVDGDEYDLETGEIERNYEIVELWTPTWNYYGYFEAILPVEPAMNGETRCVRYDSTDATTVDTMPDKSIRVAGTKVYIKDSSYTSVGSASDPTTFLGALQGVYLVYKKATPTPDTPIDPIDDPTIKIEGGGTLSTEQTNDPSIVSAMDIGYMYQ